MIDDMKLIEDVSILKKGKLVLYGAAEKGKRISVLLRNMGIEQAYFCDSDDKKWGQCMNDVEIISPIHLKEISEKCHVVVIITTQFVEELSIELEKMVIMDIYTIFALEYSLLLHLETGIFTEEEVGWFQWKKACFGSREEGSYFTKAFITCTEILRREKFPVLVYQSGKTGSTAVLKSICQHRPAAHAHLLSQQKIERYSGSNLVLHKNLTHLYQCVQDEIGRKKIKIITMVREPIAQMISRFFYNLGTGEWAKRNLPSEYRFDKTMNSLYAVFENFVLDSINPKTQKQLKYGFGFDWFNEELNQVFGIDIYGTPFNKSEGYSIISQGNVEVLCIQVEKMNELENVMSEFLEIPALQLVMANLGNESAYKYAYSSFRKQVKLPLPVLDFYYKDNEAIKHFYSDEDRGNYRKKWERE